MQANQWIVALDVSKGYADGVVLGPQGKPYGEGFRLDDTATGHEQLEGRLLGYKREHKASSIVLVVESTGGYEDNWYRLERRPALRDFVRTYRINPRMIHHEYYVQGRSSVNDRVSAETIARYAFKHPERFGPKPVQTEAQAERFAEGRVLIRHLASLEKACTAQQNALEKLLYRYLPSVLSWKADTWSNYFLEILGQYGSRKSIQLAAAQGFKQIKRVSAQRAKQLHQALKEGIDAPQTPPLIAQTIQSKARRIQELKKEIKQLETLLCEHSSCAAKHLERLGGVNGFSQHNAVVLLTFIGDYKRFESAAQMAAFFGLVPRYRSSGDRQGKARMSKQGNALVRRELYLMAFSALKHQPYLKAIYDDHRKRGKGHDAALGVVMHKLARMIYGMLKHDTHFDTESDYVHRLKTKRRLKKSQTDKKQPSDHQLDQDAATPAPLSRREKRRRKQSQPSQAAATERAGSG